MITLVVDLARLPADLVESDGFGGLQLCKARKKPDPRQTSLFGGSAGGGGGSTTVKGHQRRTKTGAVSSVKTHQRVVKPGKPAHTPSAAYHNKEADHHDDRAASLRNDGLEGHMHHSTMAAAHRRYAKGQHDKGADLEKRANAYPIPAQGRAPHRTDTAEGWQADKDEKEAQYHRNREVADHKLAHPDPKKGRDKDGFTVIPDGPKDSVDVLAAMVKQAEEVEAKWPGRSVMEKRRYDEKLDALNRRLEAAKNAASGKSTDGGARPLSPAEFNELAHEMAANADGMRSLRWIKGHIRAMSREDQRAQYDGHLGHPELKAAKADSKKPVAKAKAAPKKAQLKWEKFDTNEWTATTDDGTNISLMREKPVRWAAGVRRGQAVDRVAPWSYAVSLDAGKPVDIPADNLKEARARAKELAANKKHSTGAEPYLAKAKQIYDDHKAGKHDDNLVRARLRLLAKNVDREKHPKTAMYIDVVAQRTGVGELKDHGVTHKGGSKKPLTWKGGDKKPSRGHVLDTVANTKGERGGHPSWVHHDEIAEALGHPEGGIQHHLDEAVKKKELVPYHKKNNVGLYSLSMVGDHERNRQGAARVGREEKFHEATRRGELFQRVMSRHNGTMSDAVRASKRTPQGRVTKAAWGKVRDAFSGDTANGRLSGTERVARKKAVARYLDQRGPGGSGKLSNEFYTAAHAHLTAEFNYHDTADDARIHVRNMPSKMGGGAKSDYEKELATARATAAKPKPPKPDTYVDPSDVLEAWEEDRHQANEARIKAKPRTETYNYNYNTGKLKKGTRVLLRKAVLPTAVPTFGTTTAGAGVELVPASMMQDENGRVLRARFAVGEYRFSFQRRHIKKGRRGRKVPMGVLTASHPKLPAPWVCVVPRADWSTAQSRGVEIAQAFAAGDCPEHGVYTRVDGAKV